MKPNATSSLYAAGFQCLTLCSLLTCGAKRGEFGDAENDGVGGEEKSSVAAARCFQSSFGDRVRMWRRAEVQVVPLDLEIANRAELESLRRRAVQIEAEAVALNNPRAVRDQLDRQLQLIRALISLAERQDSDQGKSATAIAVQRHLNHIEGRIMCESCHTSVSAVKDASLEAK